jgi:hypothetical protein
MFDVTTWGHWHWVSLAWAQVLVTYGGYKLFLRWRLKRLEDRLSND